MTDQQELGQRLKEIRKAAGFRTIAAAASAFGWAPSTISAHERGTRRVDRDWAEIYAAAYGVDPDRILGRDGKVTVLRRNFVLPNATLRRDAIPQRPISKRLKVMGRAMAGGNDVLIMDDEPVEEVECPANLANVQDAYGVYVSGSSMEPRYYAGELVHVHPHRPITRDCFVVVQIENEHGGPPLGYVKQFVTRTPTTLVLRQLNPAKELEFPLGSVMSIHRIVGSSER